MLTPPRGEARSLIISARRASTVLLLVCGGVCALSVAVAGEQGAPGPAGPATSPQAPAAQPQVVMPGAEKIVILIRTAILTLNDALQTGNFTVLRDKAAPAFRDANTAARLSQVFSNLAQQGFDFSSVATIAPQIAEAPAINPKTNMLRVKGWFPAQPMQINFGLLFQSVGGRWRLFGISVNPSVPKAPVAAAASPQAAGDVPAAVDIAHPASRPTKKIPP